MKNDKRKEITADGRRTLINMIYNEADELEKYITHRDNLNMSYFLQISIAYVFIMLSLLTYIKASTTFANNIVSLTAWMIVVISLYLIPLIYYIHVLSMDLIRVKKVKISIILSQGELPMKDIKVLMKILDDVYVGTILEDEKKWINRFKRKFKKVDEKRYQELVSSLDKEREAFEKN